MGIFDFWNQNGATIKADTQQDTLSQGDVVEREGIQHGIQKGYIPEFLYKPPFGYPRGENIPQLRNFAKNGYIHAVVTALQEEAASAEWDLTPKDKESGFSEQDKKDCMLITDFLNNPNGNKESWEELVKKAVVDVCEVGTGCWNKVFSRDGVLRELLVLDGGSILKNPDVHGSIRNRVDMIFPTNEQSQLINYPLASKNEPEYEKLKNQYASVYSDIAAYYQYGWTIAALPVPFGRREIVLFEKNPRSDNVYARSPVAILADVIQTLVYGSLYNLDFYSNSNMPEGILQLLDAKEPEVKALKERMDNVIKTKDPLTGFMRRLGFKMPITSRQVNFVPFNLSSREMQIIEQQKWFTKIVWMAFGLTSDDMGDTENSNKSVSETQFKKYTRKAVRPFLKLIARRINMEIIPEFGNENIEFGFVDYDIDEDIKRHQLYESQIRMGIKTPQMVAKEEGIDIAELNVDNQKDDEANNPIIKSATIESQLVNELQEKGKKVIEAIKVFNNSGLKNVR